MNPNCNYGTRAQILLNKKQTHTHNIHTKYQDSITKREIIFNYTFHNNYNTHTHTHIHTNTYTKSNIYIYILNPQLNIYETCMYVSS